MKSSILDQGRLRPLLWLVVILTVIATAVGCGGGSGSKGVSKSHTGALRFSVAWPEASARLIPTNAQSLKVEVTQSGTTINSAVIVRPNATTSFPEVPVGTVLVKASAYASVDGTGVPLAVGAVPATIQENTTVNLDITLNSTVDHLEVTPNPFRLGATLASDINVIGRDASNNIVLLSPSALTFSSSNTGIVSVDAAGHVVAGSGLGSATITITDGDSGKTMNLPLNVVPYVSINNAPPTLTLRGTQLFTTSVVGPANQSVTWSVQEGAAGGTITSGGLYTAPATKGTYHVVATSAVDPLSTSVITVTVTSGSLGVVVR